jgi:uncharacterized protein YjiS (DUF1127 family)
MKAIPLDLSAEQYSRVASPKTAGGLGRWARAALSRFAVWRQRSRSRADLAGLDDRMLRDIGITRVEAWFECNKPFWRR